MNPLLYAFVLISLATCFGSSEAKTVHPTNEYLSLFKKFVKDYGKVYASKAEYEERLRIFSENMETAKRLQENDRGTAKYGVTEFSDLTKAEFSNRFNLRKASHVTEEGESRRVYADLTDFQLPDEFDWRAQNVVTSVKSQQLCNSGWAFAATGCIESAWAIKNKQLIDLSPQQMIDCDQLSLGCFYGNPKFAFESVIQSGGMMSEKDYPYKAEKRACSVNESKVQVKIENYRNVRPNETEMAKWLVKHGPVSAQINSVLMRFYTGGVSMPMDDQDCCRYSVDHAVLIVGYGSEPDPDSPGKKIPFWIIKNSWGDKWGENGYYRLYRGIGACGINEMVFTAII